MDIKVKGSKSQECSRKEGGDRKMAIPILLVVVVGLVCFIMLSIASKVFFVPVDETAAALRECLPGANCGGCGFAGCDDYAASMAKDRSVPCNKCPVGGCGYQVAA